MQPTDTTGAAPPLKKRSRLIAWLLLAFAFFLAPVAWIVFVFRTGPAWWLAYQGNGELGKSADRWNDCFLAVAVLLAVIATILLGSSWWKKIVYPILAAVGIAVAFWISSFVIIGLTHGY